MKYRAEIRNEKTAECPWFVYVRSGFGAVHACRFARRSSAERVAAAMNRAWEAEGRLYVGQSTNEGE